MLCCDRRGCRRLIDSLRGPLYKQLLTAKTMITADPRSRPGVDAVHESALAALGQLAAAELPAVGPPSL